MDSSQIIEEGREAEDILKSDVFKKAFENYKEELLILWESTPAKDTELRETIYMSIKLLPEVEKHLRIFIEKGKINPSQITSLRGVLKK